ncbi:MAG TPA: VOC family protein [Gemmatimonadaceae bacterium]
MITGIRKIVVPVADQESAKEFCTRGAGFVLAVDAPYGNGQRWLDVVPPVGSPALVLSPRQSGEPVRDVPRELPHSPIFFNCDDIQETYRQVTSRGVKFTAPPVRMDFGW